MGLERLIKKSHLNEEQQEVADVIGFDNYCDLIATYGGSAVWVPKARSLVPSAEITDYIRTRYQNGYSDYQIAQELELPVSEVRRRRK